MLSKKSSTHYEQTGDAVLSCAAGLLAGDAAWQA
jgi:hypothetical protein